MNNDKLISEVNKISGITEQLETKANDIDVRKKNVNIKMVDLDTEVKTAMTGGSVAVVGVNTVGSENLKPQSVTRSKITNSMYNEMFETTKVLKDKINIMKYGDFWTKDTSVASDGTTLVPNAPQRRTVDLWGVKPNDIINFKLNNNEFDIAFHIFDQNGIGTSDFRGYYTDNFEFKIPTISSTRITSGLRLLIKRRDNTTITDSNFGNMDIEMIKDNISKFKELEDKIIANNQILAPKLKIMVCNVGRYNDGVNLLPDNLVKSKYQDWRKMLGEEDVDIILGQEMSKFTNVSQNELARDIFDFKYPICNNQDDISEGLVTFSKFNISDFEYITLNTNTNRKMLKGYIDVGGKKVCVINTHFHYDVDYNINRKTEILKVIEEMKKEDYVICGGDFNTFNPIELDLFTQNGFNVCNSNDGLFGRFDTYYNFGKPDNGWTYKAIDNIVVSNNITLQNVKMPVNELSDHRQLVCEFRID